MVTTTMTTITVQADGYEATLDTSTRRVTISRDGIGVGDGRWDCAACEIVDCTADLGDAYAALDEAIIDAIG